MGRTALSGASAFTVKAGMRTDLKGFQQTFRNRNAGGLWKLGNHWLSDEETRISSRTHWTQDTGTIPMSPRT